MDKKKNLKKLNCKQHINKELEFIQVNETLNQQDNQKLFYCTSCINDDPHFKHANYQLISQVLEQGSTNLIKKWPPINDYSIILKLADQLTKINNKNALSDQIINYFSELKHEIFAKIKICQKKIIKQVFEQFQDSSQILKKYQEISKIIELKTLLNNDKGHDIDKLEEDYTKFIQKEESEKGRNTQLLQNLLGQVQKQQNLINLEYLKIMKENILSQIEQISFFNDDIKNQIDDKNYLQQNNNKRELAMKLESNKSNQIENLIIKKDILPDLNMQKSAFKLEKNTIIINKKENNQIEILSNKNKEWQTCDSNLILEQDTKYIFRIKADSLQNEMKQFSIGISYNNQKNGLFAFLQHKGQFISQCSDTSIFKQIKGNGLNFPAKDLIELRVHLKEYILEILDYPNYQFKIGVQDHHKYILKKFNDFQFGLGIATENLKLILVNTFIVDQFID